MIYLHLKGFKQKEIAEIVLRFTKTVSTYIKAYRGNGLDGLMMGHSIGAPRKLTEQQEQELVQVIAYHPPHDVGYDNHYNWTLAIMSDFIEKEWAQTYTLRGISKLLQDLGLSYTRPTYTLKKADPQKQNEFINETFPSLKKAFERSKSIIFYSKTSP